jgi:hypothetical protein
LHSSAILLNRCDVVLFDLPVGQRHPKNFKALIWVNSHVAQVLSNVSHSSFESFIASFIVVDGTENACANLAAPTLSDALC